ncbi:unnamed protein product [Rotaria sordida]|uniref:Uncharacterized protein n=1 Tax=Rotaria sordida TaxID=392033 RepID=A0A815R7J3_9BILA|nr:unnamed protein product [Rotaria sordida]
MGEKLTDSIDLTSAPRHSNLSNITLDEADELIGGIKKLFSDNDNVEKIRLMTLCPEAWGRQKIQEFFGATERQARNSIELRLTSGILSRPEYCLGNHPMDYETIDYVLNYFWSDTISRTSSNTKDCILMRNLDGSGDRKSTPVRYMMMTIGEAYEQFVIENPTIAISRSKFYSLRPKNVKKLCPHDVCVCIQHENISFLLQAWSTIVGSIVTHSTLITMMVCDEDDLSCISGDCSGCGNVSPSAVLTRSFNSNMDEVIEYMIWKCTDHKVDIHRVTSTIDELLIEIDDRWSSFLLYQYINHQQKLFIQQIKANPSAQTAIITMDFAENYSIPVQREAQSKHWNPVQVTIFTIHIKFKDGFCSAAIISNYMIHDTAFVYNAQQLIVDFIKNNMSSVKEIYYVTDNCSSHFKNNNSIFNLTWHQNDFGMKAYWIYTAASHGKSACDGIGATLKSTATRYLLSTGPSAAILSAYEFFQFCEKRFIHHQKEKSSSATSTISNLEQFRTCEVWYLDKQSIEDIYSKVLKKRWSRLHSAIPGLRQFHHFEPIKIGEVECKIVSNLSTSTSFKMLQFSKRKTITPIYSIHDLKAGDYGVVVYNDKWWLAKMNSFDKSLGKVEASVCTQAGPRIIFPSMMTPRIINPTDVICVLSSLPKITPRTISITISELDDIEKLYEDSHQ